MKVSTEECLASDRCDHHCHPQQWGSDESGDLAGGLEQLVVFDLKCLFPCSDCDLLATFNNDVCSWVWGDSQKESVPKLW